MENFEQLLEVIKTNIILLDVTEIILVTILSFIGIKIGNKIVNLIFNEKKESCSETEKRRIVTLNRITKITVKTLVIAIAAIDILSLFIDVQAILTVAGVGTIAIGIGAKAIVEDILSGFVILAENMFCVGDYIQLESHYGRVEKIGLRMTHIRQLDDSLFIVHNGEITKLTNYSKGSVRAVVLVGVAFEENLAQAYAVLDTLFEKLMKEKEGFYLGKPVVMGVEELADSAVMLRIEADVKADCKKAVERDLRQQIKEAFDNDGIEIPYNKYVVIPEKGVNNYIDI